VCFASLSFLAWTARVERVFWRATRRDEPEHAVLLETELSGLAPPPSLLPLPSF